ncbi:MAG: tetratricopeptide repeat protein [Williamsia sp.]|nr:tetratricopeptide repeat protein [Williamsia sp.]
MKQLFLIISFFLVAAASFGQQTGSYIRSGNKLYKQNNFAGSEQEYKKAIAAAPSHPLANYNLGNAQFRNNELDEAVSSYDNTVKNTESKKPVVERAYYNKGVAYSKQQKLAESIDAWKNALKIDPADQQARENLQKALMEQKKQQQQQKQNDKKNDEKKDNKQDKKEQDKQKEQQQPQQQQSKLNKKQVEQLLKALAQKENEVQQKMQQKNASGSGRQEKDW